MYWYLMTDIWDINQGIWKGHHPFRVNEDGSIPEEGYLLVENHKMVSNLLVFGDKLSLIVIVIIYIFLYSGIPIVHLSIYYLFGTVKDSNYDSEYYALPFHTVDSQRWICGMPMRWIKVLWSKIWW